MSDKVADLTIDELREILRMTIRDLVEEVVEERVETLLDPDADLDLQPEVLDSLRNYLQSERRGDPADDVWRALGLT
jgi:hypothetical protein